MINCKTCVYHNACSYDVDDCEMYIPVPDVFSTIRILEIEKQCVLRQDTPECTRECSFCDLVQNADEVISAYDTAINMLKQISGKLNSEIEKSNSETQKSKSEIVPDYRDGWKLKGSDNE